MRRRSSRKWPESGGGWRKPNNIASVSYGAFGAMFLGTQPPSRDVQYVQIPRFSSGLMTGAVPAGAARKGGVSGGMVFLVAIIMLAAGFGAAYYILPRGGTPPAKTNLLVGTNMPFPPFEDFNRSNGEIEGFDIDIAALVATELGRTLVVRQFSSFTTLLATVGTGGVDMSVSAITMSGSAGSQRNATMDFSDPYYNANQGVLVQTGSSLTCTASTCTNASLASLNVGVQQGTTSESWLNDNKVASTTVTVFQTVDLEVAALTAGSIDAVLIDLDPAESLASPGSGLRVAGAIITNELYGIAVPNGDPDNILSAINTVLARIRASGAYDTLILKWFG